MLDQRVHNAVLPSAPLGPTKSLTSMVPAYGSTVTLDAGVGITLRASSKTVEGSGGEFRTPDASVKVSATEAIFKGGAGPKWIPVTENSLFVVQVGHSWAPNGSSSFAWSLRPFCWVHCVGRVNTNAPAGSARTEGG